MVNEKVIRKRRDYLVIVILKRLDGAGTRLPKIGLHMGKKRSATRPL